MFFLVKVSRTHGGDFCNRLVILDASKIADSVKVDTLKTGVSIQFAHVGVSFGTIIQQLDASVVSAVKSCQTDHGQDIIEINNIEAYIF